MRSALHRSTVALAFVSLAGCAQVFVEPDGSVDSSSAQGVTTSGGAVTIVGGAGGDGGANLVGIEKYFQREFLIPVLKAAPLLKFEYPPSIEPLVAEIGPILSVALGLTLREFI